MFIPLPKKPVATNYELSEHWREKCHIPHTCSPQAHLVGSLPTLSLTTKGSWLPWVRVVKPVVSPLTPVPSNVADKLHIINVNSFIWLSVHWWCRLSVVWPLKPQLQLFSKMFLGTETLGTWSIPRQPRDRYTGELNTGQENVCMCIWSGSSSSSRSSLSYSMPAAAFRLFTNTFGTRRPSSASDLGYWSFDIVKPIFRLIFNIL